MGHCVWGSWGGKKMGRISWMMALLAALIVVVPGEAWSHASLTKSVPADGAIVAEPPTEIRLWFDEALSSEFSSARLLDINGQALEIAGVRTDPADPRLLIVTLRELPEGVYSVLAATLSEADGHVSRSFLVFGVGEAANMGAASGSAAEPAPPLAEVLLRWCNFTLLASIFGGLAVLQLVLVNQRRALAHDPALDAALVDAQARVIAFVLGCAGAAFVVGLGLLGWQAITLLDTLVEGATLEGVVWQIVGQTRWGNLWLVRQVLLLVILGLLLVPYRARQVPAPTGSDRSPSFGGRWSAIWLAAVLVGVALSVVQALTSHAGAVSTGIGLAVVADALHLLTAGVWVGGLFALAVGLLPLMWRDRTTFVALAHAGWGAFSPIAAVAVGLIVATGLYNMSRQVSSLDALIGTLFGQTLMFKIGVMLAVGAFGLTNSMLLHPRMAAPLAWLLGRPRGWTPVSLRRLPVLILCEGSLALLVLLATGLLTSSPTPRGLEFTVAAEEVPSALSQTIDDMVVTLLVKPNRPGNNVLTVFAASTRRPERAEIMRVILRFNNIDQDLGRFSVVAKEIEPGRFLAGGSFLSMAGRWGIDVAVRRRGLEDVVAQFDWIVAPRHAGPVIISKRPLALPLTLAAVGMLLILALVLAYLAWGAGEGAVRIQDMVQRIRTTVARMPILGAVPEPDLPDKRGSNQALGATESPARTAAGQT